VCLQSKFRIFDWKSFGQFGVNSGNTGITDLELGFEIAVLKSQIDTLREISNSLGLR
jgi:hypothetical protein